MKKACQDALAVGFQKSTPHDAMGLPTPQPIVDGLPEGLSARLDGLPEGLSARRDGLASASADG